MKTILLSFLTVTVLGFTINAQNVNIPDSNFKYYLVANKDINTNGDTEIQVSEANAFAGKIDISSKNISDITGIEAFTSLTYLNCYNTGLTTLNISKNLALATLICDRNKITSLDLTQHTALRILNCERNELTLLNVSQNLNLESLNCSYNDLSVIDVSQNPILYSLSCRKINMTTIDVTNNPMLSSLSCAENNLTVLDVSQNPMLGHIDCQQNNLTELDLTKNPDLQILVCTSNLLTDLDLSQNLALTTLYCAKNSIPSIDVSQMPNFNSIRCGNNALTYLNVANGRNKHYYIYEFNNNPALECIQVDDVEWSNYYWKNYHDSTAIYSTNCGGAVGIVDQKSRSNLSIYPNPVSSQITIDSKEQIEYIEIYNLMGELVQTKTTTNFNVADLPNGTYILKIKTSSTTVNKCFVKNQ